MHIHAFPQVFIHILINITLIPSKYFWINNLHCLLHRNKRKFVNINYHLWFNRFLRVYNHRIPNHTKKLAKWMLRKQTKAIVFICITHTPTHCVCKYWYTLRTRIRVISPTKIWPNATISDLYELKYFNGH